MTIPSTPRKAGPYVGDGANSTFTFSFKTFDKTEVQVVKADVNGAETMLVQDSGYSITLNANQLTSPGGTVTYPRTGTSYLPATEKLSVIGAMGYGQTTSLPNGGAYNASVVERALDRLAVLIQQLRELGLVSYTVASLPAALNGSTAFASNGRKVGEGPGAGTGVPVYRSRNKWRVYSTDAEVQA